MINYSLAEFYLGVKTLFKEAIILLFELELQIMVLYLWYYRFDFLCTHVNTGQRHQIYTINS